MTQSDIDAAHRFLTEWVKGEARVLRMGLNEDYGEVE